jgi:Reverse transcriptase (RNA-dependent DNA polymerase)
LSGPSSDGGQTRISTLQKHDSTNGNTTTVVSNEGKGQLLFDSFYNAPTTNQQDLVNVAYPPPKFTFIPITDTQIARAISRLHAYKAPGDDNIPNAIFIKCSATHVPYLGHLYRATFALAIYPPEWKDSRTVVLRKPGKPDYTTPGAYLPIALIRTISKILSSCMTDELMQFSKQHNLLPANHFGCCAGHSTTDSLHYVTKTAKDAMKKDKVTSTLFLDIKGAFPSVNLECLIHDMRKRGIPVEYTDWIRRKIGGRRTTMVFDEYDSPLLTLPCGTDQGCPLLGMLFQFYTADLLDVAKTDNGEDAVVFVDDTALLATATTLKAANRKLKSMMEQTHGGFAWAASHGCEFAIEKFALIGFT